MSVIKVSNLTKDYGSGRGIFDVSFEVNQGEVFGFLGPNGAGKSTTIRHLMGFSKPDKGNCEIFDKSSFKRYYEILGNVGYIPGEISLPAGLTGWQFLSMMQDLQKCHNDERLKYLLDLFKLDPSGETKRMSLGVKRKLAIVAANMNDPKVLILDEPTSGLDPVMQDVFIDFIKEEKERGKSILLSSHIFTEVDATCDRIAIIKDGKLVSNFIADDLKHATLKTYIITFKYKKDIDVFLSKKTKVYNVIDVNNKAKSITLTIEDNQMNKLLPILAKYDIKDFSHSKETLEDYFMKYYKEDKNFEGGLR